MTIFSINDGSRNTKWKPKRLTGAPSESEEPSVSAEPPERVSRDIGKIDLCKAVRNLKLYQKEAAKNISKTPAIGHYSSLSNFV